jgi:hypothetical protein
LSILFIKASADAFRVDPTVNFGDRKRVVGERHKNVTAFFAQQNDLMSVRTPGRFAMIDLKSRGFREP